VIALLIISGVIGAIVAGTTGIDVLFGIVGCVVFICGLPFALLSSFVHGEVSYAQDRADYRQAMSDIAAEELANEREAAEDARVDRLIKGSKAQMRIYNDNRQIHFHGTAKESIQNKEGVS
jgi:hypothetical protein